MAQFIVYQQAVPTHIGKDNLGVDMFEANLVKLTTIECLFIERFAVARKHTPFPVLEEINRPFIKGE